MQRCLFLLVLAALSSRLLPAADKSDQQRDIARMQEAVAKSNIFELPSFVLKAAAQLDLQGKTIEGTYQLWWNGPDQWREEISFPGYTETQVGGKGTVWVKTSTDFIPVPIFHLRQALGFGSNFSGGGGSSLVQLDFSHKVIKKERKRNEFGNKLTCFEIEDERKHASEICLNEATGLLSRNSANRAEDDFQPMGGKLFPRSLAVLEAGKTVAKVTISELTTPAQFPPNAFSPPTGVSPEPGCMNPTPPHLSKRVQPEYPTRARSQHVQGTVRADVLIGLDGSSRIRKVVESPDPDLESSALRALEGWRYDPAMCNGVPVQDITVLQVNYALSY